MILTLKIETERKLKQILDKKANSFYKFLESQNLEFEELTQEELDDLVEEYKRENSEDEKKTKNELTIIALLILENVRSNFAAALKNEYEKKKLDYIMSQLDLKKYITDFINTTYEIYSDMPERFISVLQNKDIDKFESSDDLIEATYKTVMNYDTYHSIMQSGGLYLNYENSTLKELGINSYIWRDMRDNIVRHSHEIRNGKRFDLTGKRIDGPQPDNEYYNPKEQPGCRCSKFIDNNSIRKAVINYA
ncbi:MAG: hypothetical protein LBV03_04120 [Fusobacteriales bacterium]|jgi:hypothetical protein|nr:hypothetical protein [Fusobacteriales bacterium]